MGSIVNASDLHNVHFKLFIGSLPVENLLAKYGAGQLPLF